MDLIKSGRYIDIFLRQNMCNNKNKHSGGVSCGACNAFIGFVMWWLKCQNLPLHTIGGLSDAFGTELPEQGLSSAFVSSGKSPTNSKATS